MPKSLTPCLSFGARSGLRPILFTLSVASTLAVCCVLPVSCALPGQEQTANIARTETANHFVQLLIDGKFDKAVADFDAVMLKVMPADQLKKTWESVLADAGAYKKTLETRSETVGIYLVVNVTCEFAKRPLDVRVVFNKAGKISGLQFRPAAPKGKEEIWEGKLKVGVVELRIVFHLFKAKDGSYAGTMDSPDQGAKGIPLDEVSFKDNALALKLKRLAIVVDGTRDKSGQEIKGHFKQGKSTLPITLKRVTRVQQARRPQTPRKPYPYQEVEVAYENAKSGIHLAGALTLPRSSSPVPAVLLITGSGAQDRDETIFEHRPFLVLADSLTRRGIAVLRVDDRGVGGSTGSVSKSTSADFAEDVLAGVAFLKGRKEIDPTRIGLVGHSEGGLIAPMVASRSRDIAFIVMLAGPGVSGEQILYTQGAAILKSMGADAKQLERQKEIQHRMFAILRQEKDSTAAQAKLKAAIAELSAKLGKDEKKEATEAMPELEGQLSTFLTPWFRYFLTYDPRSALLKVTCPVLALNGEKDLQVDSKINLPAIAAALKEGGNRDVTTKELANLNHLFQTCKTGAVAEYGTIEETMSPEVLQTVGDWIQQRTGKSGSR
jgi:pimeloyl-ACP methyl ester carboxylesterase